MSRHGRGGAGRVRGIEQAAVGVEQAAVGEEQAAVGVEHGGLEVEQARIVCGTGWGLILGVG